MTDGAPRNPERSASDPQTHRASGKLAGRVALVTGAGRGIGREIALAFAREGASVALVARTEAELEIAAAEIAAAGREALSIRADVSDPVQANEAVERCVHRFSRLDILVNNAGMLGPMGPLVDNPVEEWLRTVQVNLFSVFLTLHAALPAMIRQRYGKIINLSGGGAAYGRPYFTAYGASKAAVVRLTESVAEEVREFGIDVNAMAPGAVNTAMLDQVLEAGERAGEQALSAARRQRETGGVPVETPARLAVFLASSASDRLTGRLISSVHDDWAGLAGRGPEVSQTTLYTLRRVVPE
jgi:NAD(P)-dependent dehydrogenase (short-subunit alcohol dehydrogenase family)